MAPEFLEGSEALVGGAAMAGHKALTAGATLMA